MKTPFPKFLLVSFVTILLFSLSSCKKSTTSTSSVADPSGTNVVNLLIGSGVTLDDTVNAIATYGTQGLGYYFYTNSLFLNLDANLNLNFSYAAGVNASYGLSWIIGCSNGIINLGPVSGLGAITTHPTSGYSSTSLAQAGVGYVIESVDNNPVGSKLVGNTYTSVPRTLYYRVYVTTTVMNTSNAIAGYTIKYQGPF
jgi:hypothetical protein